MVMLLKDANVTNTFKLMLFHIIFSFSLHPFLLF